MSESIYRSEDAEASVFAAYDSILESWPVAWEGLDVPSPYGTSHVLVSGPLDGVPVLLFHAASMAAVSWRPNVLALNEAGFRTYAVDYIGESGRSVLDDLDFYPKSPSEIGQLYRNIADSLGIEGGPTIGASAGGHTAMRYALACPGRVSRLVLLGPMGIVPLGFGAVWRMMMVSMFPSTGRVRKTGVWALGSAEEVAEPYGSWFETVLESVSSPPRVGRPVALTSAEMTSLSMPVLLVLGDRDNLVGDPARAARKAGAFPNVTVETLDSSHLLGVEQAQTVNQLMVRFLSKEDGQ
jgi:pimeloyl-ACP methyl ester carboxylesterase